MEFRSLRWRVLVPVELAILVGMVVLALSLAVVVREAYLDQLEEQLTGGGRVVGESMATLLAEGGDEELLDVMAHQYADLLGMRVTLIGLDGTVLGESHEDRAEMENHLGRPEVQQALAEGKGMAIRFSRTVGYEMMYVALLVRDKDQVEGVVRVALPLEQIQARVRRVQAVIWSVAGGVALGSGGVVFWLLAPTIQAIRALAAALRRAAEGDLDAHILPRTDDEVGALVVLFNRMAGQLQRMMEQLKEERARLEGVLDQMNDGVVITDEEGVVRLINPAAKRVLGVEGEGVGQSLIQVTWDYRLVDLWKRGRETGEEQVEVIELGAGRGVFQVVVTPLEGHEMLVLLQDLTRVRELETVRRDFVANISHELRTPLAALKALVETLRDGSLEDREAAQRFLGRIESEVDRLHRLVGELLELARIEAGKLPLRLVTVDPAELIWPVVEQLRPMAEFAGLRLEVEIEEGCPSVWVDVEAMSRVLSNLVRNAIQFTPEGQIRVEARREGEEVIFAVRDTGVGISKEDLPRIFERFYKSRRVRSGGSGLGLAIARHLVLAHEGRIWAESVEGEGSTFFVALPVGG